MPHSILIVGAGKIGGTLGRAWLAAGHDVRFGVPDPANSKYAELPQERLQPASERRGADIIVLATPFGAMKSAVAALGDMSGAIIIDCINPLGLGPEGLELLVGRDTSGAELLAALAPHSFVFKTLNQTGVENIAGARAYHPKPVMFVAGDDPAKKHVVLELVAQLGFESVDAGPLVAARLLEPLAMLWIELAMKRGHARDFAFALVRHPKAST